VPNFQRTVLPTPPKRNFRGKHPGEVSFSYYFQNSNLQAAVFNFQQIYIRHVLSDLGGNRRVAGA
jgi:hypothetical protein